MSPINEIIRQEPVTTDETNYTHTNTLLNGKSIPQQLPPIKKCSGSAHTISIELPRLSSQIVHSKLSVPDESKSYSTSANYAVSPKSFTDHSIVETDIIASSTQQQNVRLTESKDAHHCSNCLTTTTPLWRRDLDGNILCNACGLFLKLHGNSRPISLKSSNIKSRNRKHVRNGTKDNSNSQNNVLLKPKLNTLSRLFNYNETYNYSTVISRMDEVMNAVRPIRPYLKPKPKSPESSDVQKRRSSLPITQDKYVKSQELVKELGRIHRSEIVENATIDFGLQSNLSNQVEIIKLKTRLKELELTTELYKNYILQLNERFESLEGQLFLGKNHENNTE
ncbi:hypothetical protein KAFR_0A03410 [Kazachstania africana CBS 2517]|uniref:GATA-type domain-containing protein n=1 Tax=Kazachstania africana (strain ATCC 22294 / BCRC 22015 / CBS 2517 / CECT 1963 / NBRC 1671 / NRRL Y-8276) TaxID=1071382 RepID=H2AN26_KAZAF|nr:hypothetical protein KAFR_0A03410 [Kazachstania africana CBS 2517]CCF55776.1 hypothetical protein KAFR_0A03410 [Kazachstania africana CBS 2517]